MQIFSAQTHAVPASTSVHDISCDETATDLTFLQAKRTSSDRAETVSARDAVLYVTSEIEDYVKTGGLGEVSSALPRALRGRCDIRVLLPGYRQVIERHPEMDTVANLPAVAGLPACSICRAQAPDGLTFYILKCAQLYERPGGPYQDASGNDWPDNDVRFARLGLAAAEIAAGALDSGWRPGVIHLNDWTSALAAGYLAWRGISTPTVLTIHNLAYQGLFDRRCLQTLAIPDHAFQIDGVEFYGRLSFLKAGIYYASHVTTVSTTYASEITKPEFGCGLDGLLKCRAEEGRLSGILNGIDAGWDPAQGVALNKPFDAGAWEVKRQYTNRIRENFGLALSNGPLFAIVSRLVHQKGVDLVLEAAETIIDQGGQLVVTGRGEHQLEAAMADLAWRHPSSVGVRIGFDQTEARRIFAGSDFLLMPSRFEPCGLSQMYAQSYGSLPIAHKTGGLADTIKDGRTGFLFADLSLPNFVGAIRRGLETFSSAKRLNRMRRHAMAQPFGWRQSADGYRAVYGKAAA